MYFYNYYIPDEENIFMFKGFLLKKLYSNNLSNMFAKN